MSIQVIKDGNGNDTGIFIPINDWDTITRKHEDLKLLVNIAHTPKKTMADFWAILSDATAEDLHKQTLQSRKEWDDRLKNQQ